jgi:hypothetical protein
VFTQLLKLTPICIAPLFKSLNMSTSSVSSAKTTSLLLVLQILLVVVFINYSVYCVGGDYSYHGPYPYLHRGGGGGGGTHWNTDRELL